MLQSDLQLTRPNVLGRARAAKPKLTSKQFGILLAVFSVPVTLLCGLAFPLHLTPADLLTFFCLAVLVCLVGLFPVNVSSESISLSISLPVIGATTYLFGPFAAVIVAASGMLTLSIYREGIMSRAPKRWKRLGWGCVINVPMAVVSTGIPSMLYGFALKMGLFERHSLGAAIALCLVAIIGFYISAVLSNTLAAIWTKTRWDVIWYKNYSWTLMSTALLSPLGFLTGALTEQNPTFGLGFILMPLFAIHQGYARHERRVKTYRQGVDVLGRLMQESHPYTHGHLNRVATWAVKIAERLSLPAESMAQIENAAILHDIGKIALDDRILNKVEKLTDEEWAKIKDHPVVGAEIASRMKFLEQVSTWIRHHHERIDGKGYPDGLVGDDIPVESKIICVVDAFDAMVGGPSKDDQRPYRLPKTLPEARAELVRCAGTQFDERVVTVFLSILDDEARAAGDNEPDRQQTLTARLSAGGGTTTGHTLETNVRLRTAA